MFIVESYNLSVDAQPPPHLSLAPPCDQAEVFASLSESKAFPDQIRQLASLRPVLCALLAILTQTRCAFAFRARYRHVPVG